MTNNLSNKQALSSKARWVRLVLLLAIACLAFLLFWYFPNSQVVTILCINLLILGFNLYLRYPRLVTTKKKRLTVLNELFANHLYLNCLLLALHSTLGLISRLGIVARPLWLNSWAENRDILITYGSLIFLSFILSRKK